MTAVATRGGFRPGKHRPPKEGPMYDRCWRFDTPTPQRGKNFKARWRASGKLLLELGVLPNEAAHTLWVAIADEADPNGVLKMSQRALLAAMGRIVQTGRTARDYLPGFRDLGALESHQSYADGHYAPGVMRLVLPDWMAPERLRSAMRHVGPKPIECQERYKEWCAQVLDWAKNYTPSKPGSRASGEPSRRTSGPASAAPSVSGHTATGDEPADPLADVSAEARAAAARWVEEATTDELADLVESAGYAAVVVESARERRPGGIVAALRTRLSLPP